MEIEEEPQHPLITSREATSGFKIFQQYVEENTNDPAILQMCDKFDEFLAKERVQKLKQKKILDYFVVDH
jgi:hypothetical protein